MQKVSEYQAHADECRRLAMAATNPDHKKTLEGMAAAWDLLAKARTKHLQNG